MLNDERNKKYESLEEIQKAVGRYMYKEKMSYCSIAFSDENSEKDFVASFNFDQTKLQLIVQVVSIDEFRKAIHNSKQSEFDFTAKDNDAN